MRWVLSRHIRGVFRLITTQDFIARRSELRLDQLPGRRIVFNDENPRRFAGSECGYGRLGGLIRSDCKKGQGKMEASSIARLAVDFQLTSMQFDAAHGDGKSQACALRCV